MSGSIEVVCDESGAEGRNLADGNTEVFAHASVHMDWKAARDCLHEIRRRAPSPASEYKAHLILRAKYHAAVYWLLADTGPLTGRAHVYLVDKHCLLVSTVVEMLGADDNGIFYARAPGVLGADGWARFVRAAGALLRAGFDECTDPVDDFTRTVSALAAHAPSGPVRDVLRALAGADDTFRARHDSFVRTPFVVSPANLLVPAIARAVDHWHRVTGRPIAVVHDRQPTVQAWWDGQPAGDPRMSGVTFADSRHEPRVQIADILAGVSRRIASDARHGRGDPALVRALTPFVDHLSIWGEPTSASALLPPSG